MHTWPQKSFCQLCIGSSCGCETRHLLVVEMGKGSGPKGSLPADAVPPDVVQEQRGKGQDFADQEKLEKQRVKRQETCNVL